MSQVQTDVASITLVDNKDIRGILAPAKSLPRVVLSDILDLIGYSDPKVIRRINKNFKGAKGKKCIDGSKLKKELLKD